MRTAEEIRTRFLQILDGAVRRPLMYGGSDWGVELFMRNLLSDLCFIDEREQELKHALTELDERGLSSSTGVVGSFRARIANVRDVGNEVASVYAEIAGRLGYLSLQRRLTPAEWKRLRKGLRASCRDRDWRASEVREWFGDPSLEVHTVYCYAPEDRNARWVFFDFADSEARRGGQRDYVLRNVRIPAASFERELVFTPYGRQHKRTKWS